MPRGSSLISVSAPGPCGQSKITHGAPRLEGILATTTPACSILCPPPHDNRHEHHHRQAAAPVRFNQKAHLITEARYQAWYDLAIQTAGLTDLEQAILAAVVAYYQRLAERGYAGLLSYERVADATGWPDVESIKAAVRHLVELGLVAVLPGSGPRANEYLPALPPVDLTTGAR